MTADDYNWYGRVMTALNATFYCALGTGNVEQPWVNPVFFAYDKHLNLYAISKLDSQHMRNIAADPKVAVAIYATDQQPGQDVLGLQITGTARVLRDDEVSAACEIYYGRTGAAEAAGNQLEPAQHMGPEATWKFFQIIPTEIYIFDSAHFGEARTAVPLARIIEP
jgi:nitroimidazol reductase NimA-like FMN-containing flavoprotein (pyridoxamine 5'-phosphate oxidase superfamily)